MIIEHYISREFTRLELVYGVDRKAVQPPPPLCDINDTIDDEKFYSLGIPLDKHLLFS